MEQCDVRQGAVLYALGTVWGWWYMWCDVMLHVGIIAYVVLRVGTALYVV